jgi:hypothetical protein
MDTARSKYDLAGNSFYAFWVKAFILDYAVGFIRFPWADLIKCAFVLSLLRAK